MSFLADHGATTEVAQISRDPFARTTTFRRRIWTEEVCVWCGGRRPSGVLFQYGVEQDGIRTQVQWDRGVFCCKGCRDAYYK